MEQNNSAAGNDMLRGFNTIDWSKVTCNQKTMKKYRQDFIILTSVCGTDYMQFHLLVPVSKCHHDVGRGQKQHEVVK